MTAALPLLALLAGLAAGWRLSRGIVLMLCAALLPALAFAELQLAGRWPLCVALAAGLALAPFARRAPPERVAGGAWWLAFTLYGFGAALALYWLLPFPDNRAALAGVLARLADPFARGANFIEFPFAAAWLAALAPLAARGVRGAREDGRTPEDALTAGLRLAIVWGFLFNAGALLYAAVTDTPAPRRFGGGFPDPNSAGSFWLVALAAQGAQTPARAAGERAGAWLRRSAGALGWCAAAGVLLLLTGSRITLFALPLLAAAWLRMRGAGWRAIGARIGVLVAGGWLLLHLGYRIDQALLRETRYAGALTRLYQATTPDYLAAQGISYRLSYWSAALKTWGASLHNALFGVGPGRLYGFLAEAMNSVRFPVQFRHENAHNMWLQYLAETGLVGLALFATAQRRAWRAQSPTARLIHLALLFTFVTGHPLLVPAGGFAYGLILALAPAPAPASTPRARWSRALPLAALALGLCAARPGFRFGAAAIAEGPRPYPADRAAWLVSCTTWRRFAPVAGAAPALLTDPAQRAGAIALLAPPAPGADGQWRARVRITNRSAVAWPAQRPCSPHPAYVHLAYHWRPRAGVDAPVIEGGRTLLERDLLPGETREVELLLTPPPRPADYELAPDAVQETIAWFDLPAATP